MNDNIFIRKDYQDLPEVLRNCGILGEGKKALIITDKNVAKFHLDTVLTLIAPIFPRKIDYTIFRSGEARKNFRILEGLLDNCHKANLDRDSLIIALGGGVVGDLAGFCAATYMRGISHIMLPTTTLACADSSVGGKCAVNIGKIKNIAGVFHKPIAVYIATDSLITLGDTDYANGFAEIIKHAVICNDNGAFFEYLIKNRHALLLRQSEILKETFMRSCEIKSEIVAEDFKDYGLRRILNFGHTFGHAIESLSEYTLSHGQCVALGMVCAINYVKNFPKSQRDEIIKILQFFGLPVKLPKSAEDFDITPEKIYQKMQSDKKVGSGIINLVIARSLGDIEIMSGDKGGIISAVSGIF